MFDSDYTLSKKDIANYLFDYHQVLIGTYANKFYPFYDVFCSYIKQQDRENFDIEEYYIEMLQIYMFNIIKMECSILYDERFDDFKIDEQETIKKLDSYFVNKEDAKKFSDKKKIIKYIRDAVNHNDYDSEKYVFKRINKKLYIEIKFNDVRTQKEKKLNFPVKPFHVLMLLDDFFDIMREISSQIKTINNFTMKSDNSMKMTSKNCYMLLDDFEISKNYIDISNFNYDDILGSLKNASVKKEYKLSPYMKKKIVKDIKAWEKFGFNLDQSVGYSIATVFPFPSIKRLFIQFQFDMALSFAIYGKEIGALSVCNEFYNVVTKKRVFNRSIFNYYLKCGLPPYEMVCMAYDWDYGIYLSCLIYLGYICENFIDCDEIMIGKVHLPKNRIRNSIVHARWNLTVDGIEFHDWKGLMNELSFQENPTWNSQVKGIDLMNFIASYDKIINAKEKQMVLKK